MGDMEQAGNRGTVVDFPTTLSAEDQQVVSDGVYGGDLVHELITGANIEKVLQALNEAGGDLTQLGDSDLSTLSSLAEALQSQEEAKSAEERNLRAAQVAKLMASRVKEVLAQRMMEGYLEENPAV